MRRQLSIAILTAAVLWFYMFSPWTSGITNFWLTMAFSAVVLTTIAFKFGGKAGIWNNQGVEKPHTQILAGAVIAFAMWGVFWLGDKISAALFDFARGQVDLVYSMKSGLPVWLIAVLLLLVIGPAEELFWRGYVQKTFVRTLSGCRHPETAAFIVTTIIYALVHIWSFNFMLVMAAFVAGFVWGLIYKLRPSLLPALVVSHALWDALVFVILPI